MNVHWRSLHIFGLENLVLVGHTLRRRSSMSESCTSLTRPRNLTFNSYVNKLKTPDSKTGVTWHHYVNFCTCNTCMYFVRGISGSITRHWLKLNSWNLWSSWRELDIDPHWFHLNRLIKSLRRLGEQRFACQQPFIQSVQGQTRKPVASVASWTWSVWPNARSSPEEFQRRLEKSLASGTGVVNFAIFSLWTLDFLQQIWEVQSPKGPFSSFFHPLLCGGAAGLEFLSKSVESFPRFFRNWFETPVLRTSASKFPIWTCTEKTSEKHSVFSLFVLVLC